MNRIRVAAFLSCALVASTNGVRNVDCSGGWTPASKGGVYSWPMDVWVIVGAIGAVVVAGAAIAGLIYARRALTADPRLSTALEEGHIVLAVRNHGHRSVYLQGILVTLDEGMTTPWIRGGYGPQELRGRRQAIFTTTPVAFVEHLPGFVPRQFCVRTSDGDRWWPVPPPVEAAIAQANAERPGPRPS